ncbi:permease prefix domain 1-containing protein [Propionibacterium sp.]|uniref:permease prefix domain 1-containing protein n=1 Tax=Propionibacterium sp. TaxID=1977903 RepID=UPI0039E951EC
MNATLTNRYIAAVIRTIPQRQRNDVARELGASIADQVDARVAAGEETATAEREVLTDLGDPDALAAGYTDRPLQLIGPHYYLAWWRLLKVLWAIVPVCAAFGVALGMTLAGEPTGHIIGSVAGLVISVIGLFAIRGVAGG